MKSTQLFILACICGLVAAGLAMSFLRVQSQRIEARGATATIVVARHDLPPYHPLDPEEDLRMQQVPVRQFPELVGDSLKAEDCVAFEGRELTSAIPAGMPLRHGHFAPIADLQIEDGKRAMAVQVAGGAGLQNLLVPGDRIDLMVTRPTGDKQETPSRVKPAMQDVQAIFQELLQAPRSDEWKSEMVVENVRVLAIGAALTGTREHLAIQGRRGQSRGAQTVTIEVTLDEARALLEATGAWQNPLTVLLRADWQ